jgi:hypothetical protein
MKKFLSCIVLSFVLALSGCVSTPNTGAVTTTQQRIADIAEDTLAIGLVPVLTNNPGYLDAAKGIAVVTATFTGDTLTPEAMLEVLLRFGVADVDARIVSGIVFAAWESYVKRYQAELGTSIRPDVKVFLKSVSNGIQRAAASVPNGQAALAKVQAPK